MRFLITIIALAIALVFCLSFTNVNAVTTQEVRIANGSSFPNSNEYFEPAILKVGKGTTVKWINDDDALHTVTSGSPEGSESGIIFDSSYLGGGKTYERTFEKSGTFEYYCTLHPYMKGKIVVQATPNTTSLPSSVQMEPVNPSDAENFNTNDTQNMSGTFNDTDIGISLNYPQDWTIDKDSNENYNIASFDSPDKEVHVDIRVFPAKDYKSIKEYGNKSFKNSTDYTLLQYYRNSTTLLSGKPAIKVVYLTTNGLFTTTTSKAMMFATLVPEKKSIFAVVYFADSSNFNDFLPDVNRMINSFKISDKGPIIQEED